jgi:hypothetical protein
MNIKIKLLKIYSSISIFVKRESSETKQMAIIFKGLLAQKLQGKEKPTEEEIEFALSQLSDLGKISLLLPIVALPGAPISLAIILRIEKKYNISILPSETIIKEKQIESNKENKCIQKLQ